MKRNVNTIMKALEGEVKLEHNRQRLSPFNHKRQINEKYNSDLI
jgi:hypothetical protein